MALGYRPHSEKGVLEFKLDINVSLGLVNLDLNVYYGS